MILPEVRDLVREGIISHIDAIILAAIDYRKKESPVSLYIEHQFLMEEMNFHVMDGLSYNIHRLGKLGLVSCIIYEEAEYRHQSIGKFVTTLNNINYEHIDKVLKEEQNTEEQNIREDQERIEKDKERRITRSKRRLVFERDKYRCKLCKTHKNLSVDHIIPSSKGGTNEMDNLQTLCKSCNSKKGVKIDFEIVIDVEVPHV